MYRRPEDIHHALAQACGSADLNALMALFEEGATLVPASGPLVRGSDAIRASLAGFLANPSQFTLRLEQVVEADDIALLVSSWTLTGTTPTGDAIEFCGRTSDVVRRQLDGSWRLVIAHPYGAVQAEAAESAA